MKSKSLLVAAIAAAAIGLSDLFNNAVFARQRRNFDPFTHRHRSHGCAEWVWCSQCQRTVNGRRGRKHRCVAPFIPSPPPGYRWQNGKLVWRHTR